MNAVENARLSIDTRLFLLIFFITLTIFIFTNSAHRYSFDEDFAQKQTMYIVNEKPGELYVPGNSTVLYEYPNYFPHWLVHNVPACKNAILCSKVDIGHSLTEVPFVLINHYLHFFTRDTAVWSSSDFDDPAYVYWRNSIDPDFTFLQLFYGPVFSALSTCVFFLVCRTFDFNYKTCITLAFLFGFCTLVWPYSKTSLNVVPITFFILLGFLFFRKFQRNNSIPSLILCASCLGFGYLIRQDAILFIAPILVLLLYSLRRENKKIIKLFSYVVPNIFSFYISTIVFSLRYGTGTIAQTASVPGVIANYLGPYQLFTNVFGLLLSPGVGLLIFSPVLFTIFFSFPDFYKKNKIECILFLSFAALFLFFYGEGIAGWWHGLVAWGSRYLVLVIPFLLLPLGSSIEKRNNGVLKVSLLILAAIGFFFNLVYVVQDVSWFVWGNASLRTGLFGVEKGGLYDLNIHPAIIWTFKFSPLTQSIITAFTHLQPDIFLLKLLGGPAFGIIFSSILMALIYLLLRLLHTQKISQKMSSESFGISTKV